jgi:hypothetical protein
MDQPAIMKLRLATRFPSLMGRGWRGAPGEGMLCFNSCSTPPPRVGEEAIRRVSPGAFIPFAARFADG